MERTIKSIPELERFAGEFLELLPVNTAGATVVGLSGDLGSGKTAFTKAVAKQLGITDAVLSPTFVLAKFYKTEGQRRWSRLAHIDAYRIEDPEELTSLRWDAMIKDPQKLVLVEWPERLGGAFPAGAAMLYFRFVDEGTRAIVY